MTKIRIITSSSIYRRLFRMLLKVDNLSEKIEMKCDPSNVRRERFKRKQNPCKGHFQLVQFFQHVSPLKRFLNDFKLSTIRMKQFSNNLK